MPQSGEGLLPRLVPYRMGPFAFFSPIDLPELPHAVSDASSHGIPVEILFGPVPGSIPAATFQSEFCTASASEFLLTVPDIARYYIRDGNSITIQPFPGAAPLDVRGFLLGNVFAILCHQRRLLPLHASAVRIGDGVVAFVGASGAGKSTLAAYLSQANYPLVADDICLLDPAALFVRRVLPVAPWLKLWRASLEALGQGTEGLTQTFTEEDKFRFPVGRQLPGTNEAMPAVSQDDRLPLRAVIVLERSSEPGARLTALAPVQAIGQMMKFTYQAFLLDWLGLRGEHFASCGKGLEGAKAYACERQWGFDSLPAVLDCLREEFD